MKCPLAITDEAGLRLRHAGSVAALYGSDKETIVANRTCKHCPHLTPKVQYSAETLFRAGRVTLRQMRKLQIRATVTHRTRSVGSKDQAIRAEADRGL